MADASSAARLDPLLRLPVRALEALAASLADGLLSEAITLHGVEQAAGADAPAVAAVLRDFVADGFSPRHLAAVVGGIAAATARTPKPTSLFDLVLSGPDLPGVPTADTAAVMRTLVGQATREVILVGYAVHDGRKIFEPLAKRMEEVPGLAVTLCLDIQRAWNDPTPSADLVARFARDFRAKHWPWALLPSLYYDPRSLETGEARASLHAKCVIIDRSRALVTSANFTDAAQRKNVEVGVDIRYPPSAARLADYFLGLCKSSAFVQCDLADTVDQAS
jgi:phosphatidylserine/phosphatidylglycerophosphate/cardiolipin synthase-like enzyme